MAEHAGGWILTDDSSLQHVRKVGIGRYEVLDSALLPDNTGFVCRRCIDLNDYTIDGEFNRTYLNPYDYDNPDAVQRLYGDDSGQIIAECIAETELWERHNTVFSGSYDDCLEYIRAIVRRSALRCA